MTKLSDLKVGDVVFLTDVNARGHVVSTIMKVGKKYVQTERGYDFDRETGNYRSRDWPHHRHCYSADEWQQVALHGRVRKSFAQLAGMNTSGVSAAGLERAEQLLAELIEVLTSAGAQL